MARVRAITTLLALLAGLAVSACGGEDSESGRGESAPSAAAPAGDPGPIHVHGLGVNPADGALFVATHTGLFRAARGELEARRVGRRYQDTMGFTVAGPDRFLGSGHPDARDNLPPFLGLVSSSDGGRSWRPVSLLGKRDFHVLEAAGERVYGYGTDYRTREASLLVSDDGGRSWQERTPPEPLLALAIHPRDRDRVVASGERGLYESHDAGRGWRPLGEGPALLAWGRALYAVRPDGAVERSRDAGRTWEERGRVDAEPAAFEIAGGELYLALHDGTVWRSRDGRDWHVRSRP